VASSEEWAEVAELIRQEGGPLKSRAVTQLYRYAQADGPLMIRSFERQLGQEVLAELTHALFAEKLDAIVAADSPQAFFKTALRRRAISWLRRGDSVVASEAPQPGMATPLSGAPGVTAQGRNIDEDAEQRRFVLDARMLLNSLSERDRQIAVAAGLGEDREEIARTYSTTRANVDQILSRLRKQLKGGVS
jgi:RNA polymerase sigma factor (sigma-70 family)